MPLLKSGSKIWIVEDLLNLILSVPVKFEVCVAKIVARLGVFKKGNGANLRSTVNLNRKASDIDYRLFAKKKPNLQILVLEKSCNE